jgi:hypothetical protein
MKYKNDIYDLRNAYQFFPKDEYAGINEIIFFGIVGQNQKNRKVETCKR